MIQYSVSRYWQEDSLTESRTDKKTDAVIQEISASISYNGVSHAVMMITPVHLDEFAVGFSLSESIIASIIDIYDMELKVTDMGIDLQMQISNQRMNQLKGVRRSMAGVSGCGLCGKDAIEQVRQKPNIVDISLDVTSDAIYNAQQQFNHYQRLQQQTGGIHGAAWCSLSGEIIALFEDIGRHNAVDKLIGYMALNNIATNTGFMLVSSRISFEIVQKTAQANIALVAGVSAVSSLAIELAEQSNVKLLGFVREGRYTVYS